MAEPVSEAIILAGGLGTRLRDTVPDLPKCMAPVAGQPFLFYVINYLRSQGIRRFVFSLGYKHELIETWLAKEFSTLDYTCTIEETPLGTGGAIKLACSRAISNQVLVTNGDSYFAVDIDKLQLVHRKNSADATLALKPMKNFDRYGVVETDATNRVTSFKEKHFYHEGNINGGVYILNKNAFLNNDWPEVFSFEKSFLEDNRFKLYGSVQDEYFIDIGVPGDYNQAQVDFTRPQLDLKKIDKSWTLFIDRDGVINHEKKEDYIRNWEEFQFYERVPESFKTLADRFGKIIVISNQRGVGRGLMTEDELLRIHQNMESAIVEKGGRIDHIYYCTATDNKDINRKPNPGMAFQARKDFPDIDLSRAIMLGNKLSDMQFARYAGTYAVFIASTNPDTPYPHPSVDLRFESLPDFAKAL